MRAIVVLAAASGVVLVAAGLPPFRKGRLAARVDPYLSGLHGRPSRLLARTGTTPHGLLRSWIARWVAFVPADHLAHLVDRLDAAGFRGGPDAFRVQQATWAAAGGLVGACSLALLAGARADADLRIAPVVAVVGGVTGWLARDWWLSKEAETRRRRLTEELPVAIDLVTLSIMAGESVAAAFARTSAGLGGGVGDELGRVVADVRSGTPIIEALEALGRRVPDPAFARFVDALCTGIEKGAPLADVLRAQADDARDARRRRLLELGGRREVLMLVPVVFLIMPVVTVFALFPGLVSLDLIVP